MTADLVSVVVPAYNAAETLPALLASLAAQDDCEGYEVVLSDDASTDATVAVALRYAGSLSLVIHEAAGRRGAYAARNAGAAIAGGELLAFCDADDVVHESWLRMLRRALSRRPLVAGAVHQLAADGTPRPDATPTDVAGLTAYYGHLPWAVTANLAVRRDAFRDVGGFTEALWSGGDADLCWRLAARGVELVYEPAAIVFKRSRANALATLRQYFRYGLEHPRLYRRHRDAGMPRRSPAQAATRYGETATCLARGLRHPRSSSAVRAAAAVGQDAGRLIGSLRAGAMYL